MYFLNSTQIPQASVKPRPKLHLESPAIVFVTLKKTGTRMAHSATRSPKPCVPAAQRVEGARPLYCGMLAAYTLNRDLWLAGPHSLIPPTHYTLTSPEQAFYEHQNL